MIAALRRSVFYPLWEAKNGEHRLRHLGELSRTQWLSGDELAQRQWRRTREAVERAFRDCPYYRERWSAAGFDGVLETPDAFRALPIVSKRDVREHADRMVSRRFRRDDLVEARTGGSTGTALVVRFDRECQQLRNAAAMRSDGWAGWEIGMPTAAVWGNPPVADTLKAKLRDWALGPTVYLDTMDLHARSVERFVRDWRRARAAFLFGHAHSLYVLATMLRRAGIDPPRPRGIVATSMMLLEPERAAIEEVFGSAVTNRYGCEEVGLIAAECELHRGLHQNVDHLVVEFLRDDGGDAQPGEDGRIVVTDLVNEGMPLIRYEVGDVGVPARRRCACGRGLPLMERVVGRQADFLKRADGSLVAGVSLVERTLTAIPGIEQMQLVQEALGRVVARVVPGPAFGDTSERSLRDELVNVFGAQTDVEVRRVDALDRTPAGKYRFAICHA